MKMTLKKLESFHPCIDGLDFAKKCDGDFQKIWQTCDRGDWLIWLMRRCNLLNKKLAVEISIECAKHVISNFEKKYPDDLRPRQAIEAAEKWLKSPTEKNKNAAADANAAAAAAAADAAYAYAYASAAAAAAYAAAHTAAAAAAADAAAYAADAAADAAAYAAAYASAAAAYAAAYASAAAAAAAYAAAYASAAAAERKWQADKIREIVGKNPFKK